MAYPGERHLMLNRRKRREQRKTHSVSCVSSCLKCFSCRPGDPDQKSGRLRKLYLVGKKRGNSRIPPPDGEHHLRTMPENVMSRRLSPFLRGSANFNGSRCRWLTRAKQHNRIEALWRNFNPAVPLPLRFTIQTPKPSHANVRSRQSACPIRHHRSGRQSQRAARFGC